MAMSYLQDMASLYLAMVVPKVPPEKGDQAMTPTPPTMAEQPATERIGPTEAAFCMGMDALRIAVGLKPRNFTYEQVMRWLRAMKK